MSEELFADAKEKIKAKIDAAKKSNGIDEIVCIVDRSGSMWSIKEDASGSLNSFVSDQAEVGDAKLTIVEFDEKIDIVCDRVDIKEAQEYKLDPRGSTALLDAIGSVVSNNLKYNTKDGKTIVVVITDGGENASKEWSRDDVFKLISERKEEGWEFLFLASNQNAIAVGGTMGFASDETISYSNDAIGTQHAHAVGSLYVSTMRSSSRGIAQAAKKEYVAVHSHSLSIDGAVEDKK